MIVSVSMRTDIPYKHSKLLLGSLQGLEKITDHYLVREKINKKDSRQISFY